MLLRRLLLLAACAAAFAGCGEDRAGRALPPGYREDVFPQIAASRIDTLWVIDNSASMGPHQRRLASSLSRFMDQFASGRVDYRIAVTTTDVFTDQGRFIGTPAVLHPSLTDPIAAFERNVLVGTDGKGHEEAFEAARLAIAREKLRADEVLAARATCQAGCAAGAQACVEDCATRHEPEFMRPDAHLYLVFVSDEEEQSFGEVRYFQRSFEAALGLGNDGAVSVATICGDVPAPTCEAQPGVRYVALAGAMGGIVGSICDDDFDRHLERMAAEAVGLKHKFQLSKFPLLDTLAPVIRYRCDTPRSQLRACQPDPSVDCANRGPEHLGIGCVPRPGETDGWIWEPASRSLLFQGAAVPGLRSVLVVGYQIDEGTP